ncbi:hypothetical protein [Trichormus sp. NMC-1]|uniref:hypothetical protein n=1 Tax=Trichormus sp. NMC-1 TaxID=1853259 RepID=UPI0008DC2597|nr:hypothetical protein [Trichormus sp. NMC-1]
MKKNLLFPSTKQRGGVRGGVLFSSQVGVKNCRYDKGTGKREQGRGFEPILLFVTYFCFSPSTYLVPLSGELKIKIGLMQKLFLSSDSSLYSALSAVSYSVTPA